jgi:hypothetical protein
MFQPNQSHIESNHSVSASEENLQDQSNPQQEASSQSVSPEKMTNAFQGTVSAQECCKLLGIQTDQIHTLPFTSCDITAGSETELQVAVIGDDKHVDLPCTIKESSYYANILRRSEAGDTQDIAVENLNHYLNNPTNVWENSWVRFPLERLSNNSLTTFNFDLKADKGQPSSEQRSDTASFLFTQDEQPWVRVPISYVVKLSLADMLDNKFGLPEAIKEKGKELLINFSNDNTSPETHSFKVLSLSKQKGLGFQLARETSHRFLFTHLLSEYANKQFGLEDHQQQSRIFFSPHPPIRQKQLNDCISDNFYRELFMSPCLSGWDQGEEKHAYMALCHQVLSRSHLNSVAKMRDAGIINSNLVIMPNTSNISLANNGTHISLGSEMIRKAVADEHHPFNKAHEKLLGDLVIKITEHFLPLYVGNYTAAPYRIEFEQFHPETVLGFLPHEMDFTHLRMFWRRWKNKAKIKFIGRPITPFGPYNVDKTVSSSLGLKGDFVPDFRLIDYPAALLSTEAHAALDGKLGNQDLLKKDLDKMGIFDKQMSMYLLFKLREYDKMGYCGYEGRHYSLFRNLEQDMGQATNLQILIQALAYKLIASGKVSHKDIPDSPEIESERRQFFFAAATDIRKFSMRENSDNAFLKNILESHQVKIKKSRRNKGYNVIRTEDYLDALVNFIEVEGADLIEELGLEHTLKDLKNRLHKGQSVSEQLVKDILKNNKQQDPIKVPGLEFNQKAEHFYREELRQSHLNNAFNSVKKQLSLLSTEEHQKITEQLGIPESLFNWLANIQQHLLTDTLAVRDIRILAGLIIYLDCDMTPDQLTAEPSLSQHSLSLNQGNTSFSSTISHNNNNDQEPSIAC